MNPLDPDRVAWDKMDGLIPAVVQDAHTAQVLMVGYMNRDALIATQDSGFVTFFSRSKQRLWQKGETSGHRLELTNLTLDCDSDALLVRARPHGPTCHKGTTSCFGSGEAEALPHSFLQTLTEVITARASAPAETSYTRRLLDGGPLKVAQKVGEEGVEVALAGAAQSDAALVDESADLVFHLMVLLHSRGLSLADVSARLAARHSA